MSQLTTIGNRILEKMDLWTDLVQCDSCVQDNLHGTTSSSIIHLLISMCVGADATWISHHRLPLSELTL